MCTPPADISGLLEETKDENVKEEKEEEPEEEQEEQDTSSSKGNEPDPWSPLCKNVRKDLKELYLREVQQFVDWGKSQDFAENAPFYTLLPVSRRSLRRMYLEHLK